MKKLTILFLFFVCSFAFSQQENKTIIFFVNDNLEKKVGDGRCMTLVEQAILQYKPKGWKKWKKRDETLWVTFAEAKKSGVIPGDIMVYNDVVKDTTKPGVINHIAIVYDVIDSHTFVIAEQNTTKESKVVLNIEDIKKIYKGEILIYSPIPQNYVGR